jgi:hypothetical protein
MRCHMTIGIGRLNDTRQLLLEGKMMSMLLTAATRS